MLILLLEEIYEIGLGEVWKIKVCMYDIMWEVEFDGDLLVFLMFFCIDL